MTFEDIIAGRKVLVTDGAWGTELAKKGLGAELGCPELLNVDNTGPLLEVGKSYVGAGSDIILTNTFGGNPFKLKKYGLDERLEELNEAGVRVSKEAAGKDCRVFGSIGPTGEFLAPLGLVTEEEMIEALARQVRAFVRGGADAVLCETMTDLGEITCAIRAVKDNSDLPVVCSMTYDKGAKEYATMMGVKPEQAAEALEKAGAAAVGANCGSGIDDMIEIARLLKPATSLPIWCKPNAGLPELVGDQTVYRETPEEMAEKARTLIGDVGVTFIGGCCGTTPAHIATLRAVVDELA